MRLVPSLIIGQHHGGGKADQILFRGFDSDHGTDFQVTVDGIPVNMPSNAHGQGYADLHWLIPETIDRVEIFKGSYFPHLGDFGAAQRASGRRRRGAAMLIGVAPHAVVGGRRRSTAWPAACSASVSPRPSSAAPAWTTR